VATGWTLVRAERPIAWLGAIFRRRRRVGQARGLSS
jgi:hypothetical protein